MDPDKFIRQIADAGYQARRDDIRLTLSGKVTRDGDRFLLAIEDVKPPVSLALSSDGAKGNEAKKSAERAKAEAEKMVGQTVVLEGYWKPADRKKVEGTAATLVLVRVIENKAEPDKSAVSVAGGAGQ